MVEGHWKFRFDVDYEDASVTLGGGETFTQNGMTFTVDAVPVGVAAVDLGPGAAVDRHGGGASLLQHLGELHAVAAALVPAPAEGDD